MARIYSLSDRIKVKIEDITLIISPLNYHQKAEIESYFVGFHRGDVKQATQALVTSLKYTIKGIEGVEGADGNPYELTFEDGVLTEDCVSELLNLDISSKMQSACAAFLHGIPTKIYDQYGQPIEGVEVLSESDSPNV